jgi:hypothetical protein
VIADVRLGGRPDAVAASADGSAIYVSGRTATRLTIVSAATSKVSKTITIAAGSTSVAVTG